MTAGSADWGSLAGAALTAILFGWMFWAAIGRRRRRADDGCVPNLPPGTPYRIYTTKYDLTLRAREVPRILASDEFLRSKNWLLRDPSLWHVKVAEAQGMAATLSRDVEVGLRKVFANCEPSDWAIFLLVDHSGSMRQAPILNTAATIRCVSDALVAIGANVAISGFSTVGWHGGRARQDWLWNGQPRYPGRLCAVLHIDYQTFGESMADEDWAVMLHPDVLRENVDGEALAWAAGRLAERSEQHRLLIVLSDGAPVDDATLMHNGTAYLERHLLAQIAEIQSTDAITLGALGIGFDVSRYYRRSRSAKDLAALPDASVGLIGDLVADVSEGMGE